MAADDPLSLIDGPIFPSELGTTLVELAEQIYTTGISSGPVVLPPRFQELGEYYPPAERKLNLFALAVNKVTAPDTISTFTPSTDEVRLTSHVNTMIKQANGHGRQHQVISTVGLTNLTFVPDGINPITVGSVGVTMAPASPAFTGTVTLGGTDAAKFQLTNGGVLPCVLQAKSTTGAGTYSIQLTATQGSIRNSPFTAPFTIISGNIQSFFSLSLNDFSFSPDGVNPARVGAVVATLNPASPTSAATIALGGADAASFQLTNGGALPCDLQAKAATGAGTYIVTLTATQVGVTGSPFTSSPLAVTGSASSQLATLTLVNTSGSTQAADFVSPIFGWPFKMGDIPTGYAPQFQIAGINQPYSWGCQTYWSDGSLKFAAFMLRCDTAIAGSGSLSIDIFGGGAAPTTSARTLAEVYAELIQVNIVAASISNAFLTGTWNAVLASGAHNLEQHVYLDGDAGKVWRILTDFVQSAAAHGQLVTYHYVAALTDSAGALGGFRYLPCVTQPWYDINSPTKNWRAITTLNWQHGGGPTTVAFVKPFSSAAFSGSGGSFLTTAPNDWDLGSDVRPVIPGRITTSGGFPGVTYLGGAATLDADTMYWAYSDPANNNFQLSPISQGVGAGGWFASTSAGTGTNTFIPCYAVLQFNRHFGATIDGKWNYFQGAGSLAAEATVRTQIDKIYWRSTRVVPSYNLALSVTDNTSTQDWNMQAFGPLNAYQQETGDRADLGIVTAFSARHFFNQTALSEKVTRICGLSSGGEAYCVRDSATRQILNLSSTTYSGMMTGNVDLKWRNGVADNFTGPTNGATNGWSQNDTSHQPELPGWAYMFTGEPQFLDMLIETAAGGILSLDVAGRNPTSPVSVRGITTGMESDQRILSWATRNLNLAAGLAPATMPDGSHVNTYLIDRATLSNKYIMDIWTASTMNSYCVSTGFWSFVQPATSAIVQASWQRCYTIAAVCLGATLLEDSNSLAALQSIFAAWYNHALNSFGGWAIGSYYEVTGTAAGGDSNHEWPMIADDSHWAPRYPGGAEISWASGSNPTFTATGFPASGWSPANNDRYIFFSGTPAGLTPYTPYYAASVSGAMMKLRTAPNGGGSPVTTSSSGGPISGDGGVAMVPAVDIAGTVNFPGVQATEIYGSANWGNAILGSGDFNAIVADMAGRLSGGTPTDNPQWAMQGTF